MSTLKHRYPSTTGGIIKKFIFSDIAEIIVLIDIHNIDRGIPNKVKNESKNSVFKNLMLLMLIFKTDFLNKFKLLC